MPAVYVCGEVTSALDIAHGFVAEGCLPVWAGVLARNQTQGRGQIRREWFSPPGNLYAALRLPGTEYFTHAPGAPLVGALLVRAFARLGISLSFKWPNAALLMRKDGGWGKVAGILLEERAGALIAGIGVNLSAIPSSELLREGGMPAACLYGTEKTPSEYTIFLLWHRLVDSLLFCYHEWIQFDDETRHRAVERDLVWKDEKVVLDDGQRHQGRLLGLGANGGIRLLIGDREKEFVGGALLGPARYFQAC